MVKSQPFSPHECQTLQLKLERDYADLSSTFAQDRSTEGSVNEDPDQKSLVSELSDVLSSIAPISSRSEAEALSDVECRGIAMDTVNTYKRIGNGDSRVQDKVATMIEVLRLSPVAQQIVATGDKNQILALLQAIEAYGRPHEPRFWTQSCEAAIKLILKRCDVSQGIPAFDVETVSRSLKRNLGEAEGFGSNAAGAVYQRLLPILAAARASPEEVEAVAQMGKEDKFVVVYKESNGVFTA